jgi:hypothetical protein
MRITVNKLYDEQYLKENYKRLDLDQFKAMCKRRIGRSTGIALQLVGKAMVNPDKKIWLFDHYEEPTASVQGRNIAEIVTNIIDELNIRFISLNYDEHPEGKIPTYYIIYEPFTDMEFSDESEANSGP